jgi:hypothetical protein
MLLLWHHLRSTLPLHPTIPERHRMEQSTRLVVLGHRRCTDSFYVPRCILFHCVSAAYSVNNSVLIPHLERTMRTRRCWV